MFFVICVTILQAARQSEWSLHPLCLYCAASSFLLSCSLVLFFSIARRWAWRPGHSQNTHTDTQKPTHTFMHACTLREQVLHTHTNTKRHTHYTHTHTLVNDITAGQGTDRKSHKHCPKQEAGLLKPMSHTLEQIQHTHIYNPKMLHTYNFFWHWWIHAMEKLKK